MLDILTTVGRFGVSTVEGTARFLSFLDDVLLAIVSERGRGNRVLGRVLVHQIYFTGVDAMPMLTVLSVLVGIGTTLSTLATLPNIGAADYIGPVIVAVVLRELAPILTAVIVIARSCTAIAAELASMSIEDEISAMKVMKINPIRLVVVPRLAGCIVAMLCLTSYFATISILSGYAAASLTMDYPLETFLVDVVAAMRPVDIVVSLGKALVFGTIIPVLGCYYGLSAKYSSTEIPQMTTKATIRSLVWCFVAGSLITLLTYG